MFMNSANFPDRPGARQRIMVALLGCLAVVMAWGADLDPRLWNYSSQTNHWLVTRSWASVVVAGDYAYLSMGTNGLAILNVTNPASPVLVRRETNIHCNHVAIQGNFAYLAAGTNGLDVLDVSNPTNATPKVGHLDIGNAWRIVVAGNSAYLVDKTNGLFIVNVSNPAVPTLFKHYLPTLPTNSLVLDVAVTSTHAYLADYNNGLLVVNISPASPELVGAFETNAHPQTVTLSGDYAYVGENSSTLAILSINTPTNLVLAGSIVTAGNPHDIFVTGNRAYVAASGGGLDILDITTPSSPLRLSRMDSPWPVTGVWVANGTNGIAYTVDDQDQLEVIDVKDAYNPKLIGHYIGYFSSWPHANSVTVVGNYAYVAYDYMGLGIWDLTIPGKPVYLGGYDTKGIAHDVKVVGNLAYVADDFAGLQIINVSNPTNCVWRGELDTGGFALAVAVAGNLAYVADFNKGVVAVDISNPAAPVKQTNLWDALYLRNVNAYDVALSNQYLFVACGLDGLWAVDVSNPLLPVLAYQEADNFGATVGVTIYGKYLYLANSADGFQIRDISGPPALWGRITGSQRTGGYVFDVAILPPNGPFTNTYAFVADYDLGLGIYDVSDPSKPVLVTRNNDNDHGFHSWGIAASPQYAFLASGYSDLSVINWNQLANPQTRTNVITGGETWAVAIQSVIVTNPPTTVTNRYAYVADGWAGLKVLSLTNLDAPVRVGGYVESDSKYVGITLIGDLAYVANYTHGLIIFNISNPAQPLLLGRYDTPSTNTPGTTWSVAVVGTNAYLADGPNGLVVLDISNPATPKLLGTCTNAMNALAVRVVGSLAYVATGTNGLQILDVSVPTNIVQVGNFAPAFSDDLDNLEIVGTKIYLTAGWNGLWVLDASNPTNLVLQGRAGLGGYAGRVVIAGSYAYVADWYHGLHVVDISNPNNPLRVGGNGCFYGRGLAVEPDAVFLAAQEKLAILNPFTPFAFIRLAASRIPGGNAFILSGAGLPSLTGRLQTSANLTTWQDWMPVKFTNSNLLISAPFDAGTGGRFYRLVVP
jgi:hypothetical protein